MSINTKRASASTFFSRGFDATATREDLLSHDESRQMPALMQAIALMAIGKDMSILFTEVASLTSCRNTTIKRLVYLYLQQYSRIQPEKAVLQSGTFVKDSLHESPLVRGAAIRAMTALHVSAVSDFVKAPLRRLLDDSDPYVRRNAVLGFLKSICVSQFSLLGSGILEKLMEMLHDESQVVVASVVLALQELQQRGIVAGIEKDLSESRDHLTRLLDEATEWPAFYILEGLAQSYSWDGQELPVDFLRKNEGTIMRTLPFMCYSSAALVTAAAKVICQFLLRCEKVLPQRELWEVEEQYGPLLAGALVSQLGSAKYEIRYVVLRNIQLLLKTGFNRFFYSYLSSFRLIFDDPLYIKLEKIHCLVELANDQTGASIMEELFTHTTSTIAELSRATISSIGRVASAVESLAQSTVHRLEVLTECKVPCAVEESVAVLHELLRRYPNQYPSAVNALCSALPYIKSPEARAAVVWTVGEQSENIHDPLTYLSTFVENFVTFPQTLQLTILTTVCKIFFGGDSQEERESRKRVLGFVIDSAVKSPDPVVRERGIFYLRLLALDPSMAKKLFLHKMSVLSITSSISKRESLCRTLLPMMGTLVSVRHTPISYIFAPDADEPQESDEEAVEDTAASDEDHKETREGTESTTETDALGRSSSTDSFVTVLSASEANGLKVEMKWDQLAAKLVLCIRFSVSSGEDNITQAIIDDVQINRNIFGLGVAQVFPVIRATVDSREEVNILVSNNNQYRRTAGIEVALRIQPLGIKRVLSPPIPPTFLLLPPVQIEKSGYAAIRQRYSTPAWSLPCLRPAIRCATSQLSRNVFQMFSLSLVHSTVKKGYTKYFLYGETTSHDVLLYEITISSDEVHLFDVFAEHPPLASYFAEHLAQLLRHLS